MPGASSVSGGHKDGARGSTELPSTSAALAFTTSPGPHDDNEELLDTSGHSEEISVIDDTYNDVTPPIGLPQSTLTIPRTHDYEDSSSCESSPSSSPPNIPMITHRHGLLHMMTGQHMLPMPLPRIPSSTASAANSFSIPSMSLHDRLTAPSYPHN